jgi:protocatechuate 3,4-dioxygenase, beta subunit
MPNTPKMQYPRGSTAAHPAADYAGYRSTEKRHPKQPLILMPHTLSELTGPVYGHDAVRPEEADLTRQHAGEPLGERIVVTGRVLDEDGRPVPNTVAMCTLLISTRPRLIRISPALGAP